MVPNLSVASALGSYRLSGMARPECLRAPAETRFAPTRSRTSPRETRFLQDASVVILDLQRTRPLVQRTSIQGAVCEFATITCHRLASAIARVILRRHGWTCVVLVISCGLRAPVARGLVAGRLAGLQPVCGRRRATPSGPALAGPAMTIGRPMSFMCGASSVPGTFGNTSRRPAAGLRG